MKIVTYRLSWENDGGIYHAESYDKNEMTEKFKSLAMSGDVEWVRLGKNVWKDGIIKYKPIRERKRQIKNQ